MCFQGGKKKKNTKSVILLGSDPSHQETTKRIADRIEDNIAFTKMHLLSGFSIKGEAKLSEPTIVLTNDTSENGSMNYLRFFLHLRDR